MMAAFQGAAQAPPLGRPQPAPSCETTQSVHMGSPGALVVFWKVSSRRSE